MINVLKFYIHQVSEKRAETYSESWFTIGKVIHTYLPNSEGLNLFHEFSQRHRSYNPAVCQKKWVLYKRVSPHWIITLKKYVIKDSTIYNPNHGLSVPSAIYSFITTVIVPKLSIRRLRNVRQLNDLCSALYHMSDGADDAEKFCKRITDTKLQRYFIATWEHKKFYNICGVNEIIAWLNIDEQRKPHPKAVNIKLYSSTNEQWLENTRSYLLTFDNAGHTPRYFKVTATRSKQLKPLVLLQKQIEKAHDANQFELADILVKRKVDLLLE